MVKCQSRGYNLIKAERNGGKYGLMGGGASGGKEEKREEAKDGTVLSEGNVEEV